MTNVKESFQIGWYTLGEDTQFTNRSYECAGWHQTLVVPTGKYPIMARQFYYNERDERITDELHDRTVVVKLTGTVIGSDFSARFCGNIVGNKVDSDKGEQSEYILNPYSHALAKNLLEGKYNDWELFPEYEAREIPFISFDGTQRKTYGIFKVDEDQKYDELATNTIQYEDNTATWHTAG